MFTRLTVLALLLISHSLRAAEKWFELGDTRSNAVPTGFRSALAGAGAPGEWRVIPDEVPSMMPANFLGARAGNQRPVLAQLSRDPADERYPLLIYDDEIFGDFVFVTKFKIVSGDQEQMAGIAFHLQDESNFYYIRASAKGRTFSFFKMVGGRLADTVGSEVAIEKGVWHELRVECRGNQIRGALDGREHLLVTTLGEKTFASGKVAFWTKSDSVSYFTDARIAYTPQTTLAQALVRDTMKKYSRLIGVKLFAATTNDAPARIIASYQPTEVGVTAEKAELDTLATGRIYYGKGPTTTQVTLPLHDSNGEIAAAVRVIMKTFPGETEKTAIIRAMPVVKEMEARVRTAVDLVQ